MSMFARLWKYLTAKTGTVNNGQKGAPCSPPGAEAGSQQPAKQEPACFEERFKAIMDSLGAMIHATDAETGEVIFANKAVVELLGYDPRGRACPRGLSGGPGAGRAEGMPPEQGGDAAEPMGREVYGGARERRFAARDAGVVWTDGRRARLTVSFDTTASEHGEPERALSQEKLLEVLDAANMGLQVFELRGDGSLILTSANRSADELAGLTHGELAGRHLEEAFPVVRGSDIPRMYRLVAAEGGTWDKQWVNRKGDAVESAVELRVFQVQPGTVAALILDNTERFLAKEALEASEEKYRLVVENAGEGIFLIQDQRIKFCNQRALDMSGYAEQECMGMSFLELIHPDDRERVREYNHRRMGGDPEVPRCYRLRGMHKSGTERWLEINGFAVPWEGKPTALVFVKDITESMDTEQALKESEERYRSIFESAIHAISLVSWPEGRFLDVNPGWCRDTGYSREEAVGASVADLDPHMSRADLKSVVAELRRTGMVESRAMQFQRKGGSIMDTIYTARLVHYMGRESVLTVVQDITRIRAAERAQATLQAQLQQAQKMEAVGTLAGGVAHDFNNILQAIRSYSQLLSVNDYDVEARRDYLAQISAAAERASELVQRLLTFSRKVEPSLKPLDLNEEVRQVVKLLERTIPKMVSIRTELTPGPGLVSGDATQLEQVLLNLSNNAADAMPDGGELTIGTRQATLDEDFCRQHPGTAPGRYLELRVADNGQGMEPETLAHIFEPFFTTKEIGKGTGLGMSTVYGIVAEHHGSIICQSTPGRGTVFRVFLPALEEKADQQAPRKPVAPEVRGGTETILLVDDEPSVAATAREILEMSGYRVLTAQSGEEALEIHRAAEPPVDLVVLDMMMPGMGGRKALEGLRESQPGIKVVVASGYSFQDSTQDLLDAGAARVLAKPYHFAELLKLVRQVLDQ